MTSKMIKKIVLITGLFIFSMLFSQQTHTVEKGDNPYNIAKKYGMSVNDLFKLNPKVKDGKLAIGDQLHITNKPKKSTSEEKPKTTSAALGKIILQPKQTIYGITKQYHVSETDLRKWNPNLDAGMKIGDEISLPVQNIKKYGGDQPIATTETTPKETPIVANSNSDTYLVQPKDNYYRITKAFQLTQNQLFALNPGLEERGLQPGETIKIRENANENTTSVEEKPVSNNTKSSNQDEYLLYTVQNGDTVFSILNQFGITMDELLLLNPELENGLKPGKVLKINKLVTNYSKKSGDALQVALLLPFGFDQDDAKYRNMAIDFLLGAKLAIERNVRIGQKLEINVIDSGTETGFKKTLAQLNIDNTDLIIGPFLKSNILETLEYVGDKKIPVVAPFANAEEMYNYSNLVIVQTNDHFFADRIVKEVKDVYSDQKIYIVADANKKNANYIKSGLEKVLKNPNVILVNSSSEIKLDQNMMTGLSAPVIAVLANDDNSEGENFANKIIEISKETKGVKAMSMYYVPIFEKKVDELSQANLVYLMDRKINADEEFAKEIVASYKAKYCKTPAKFAIIGFDVVNDILTRENNKGELFKQIEKVQTQLATKFEFVRVKKNGAYINSAYRVVRLIP